MEENLSEKMQLSIKVFVEISLLFVVHSYNISIENKNVDKIWSNRSSHLREFLFEVSPHSRQSHLVDCFGLGTTIATALEWFLMASPDTLQVQFFLSSRKQPQRVKVMIGEQFGLEWTDFKVERRTIMIIHGFLVDANEPWIIDLEQSYLRWGDVNVIIVDWGVGGSTWNYYKAAVNSKLVGYQISRFLEHIENATYSQANSNDIVWGPLNMVGHSLGAHICGFASRELKKRGSPWKVQRITGLDPAQPCFKYADPSLKLSMSDAPFVDVIHTNGQLLNEIGFGLPEPMGHVDFYPNGGKYQPACIRNNSTSIFSYLPIPIEVINKSICSHGMSYVYLNESLVADTRNCTFWAHHWDMSYRSLFRFFTENCNRSVCSEMGINAENYPHRGTFFVATTNITPFCVRNRSILEEVIMHIRNDFVENLLD